MDVSFNDEILMKLSVKQIRELYKGKKVLLELALKRRAALLSK